MPSTPLPLGYNSNAMNSTKKAIEESIPDEFQKWLVPTKKMVAGLREIAQKRKARHAARKEEALNELDHSE